MNSRQLALVGLLSIALPTTHVAAQLLRDPLHVNPPELTRGVVLPGDDRPPPCGVAPDLSQPLGLDEAADLALCRNPQVQVTWAEVRAEAAAVGEAKAAYWPTITGSFTEQRDATTYPGNPALSNAVTAHSSYASLTWRLFDFGGRAAGKASAYHLLASALATHSAELQSVLDDLVGAYFDAMTTKGAVDARRQAEGLSERAVEAAARREHGGAGSHSDVLLADAARAKADLALSRAVGSYDKALALLVYALGLPPSSSLRLPDIGAASAEPVGDLAQWMEIAKREHPELLAAREQWLAAKQDVRSARANGLPTVDLGTNFYENGYPNQGLQSQHYRQAIAGVTITVPLFDGFARSYRLAGAKAEADVKKAQYEDDQHKVLMNIVKAHADAEASAADLQASAAFEKASDASVDSAQRRYAGGAASVLELLTAQSTLADARQERVRCLAEWNAARLRLMASAGQLGLRRLDRPLQAAPVVDTSVR